MLDLSFLHHAEPLRILCIGAHCDDIEIGCGASLLALEASHPLKAIDWVILSGSPDRRAESRAAMNELVPLATRGELVFGDFTDGCFPADYRPLKRFFEDLKGLPPPDLIFTHERDDRHQDHRACNELAWSTFRNQLILEFEIPKWDGGLGQPAFYVPIAKRFADRKIDALLNCHLTQTGRDWFTRDTFESLMRLRGIECRSPSGLAEAFHLRKAALNTGS